MPSLSDMGNGNIDQFIIENIRKNQIGLARKVAERFSVTRQTANRHLQRLIDKGIISAKGKTKAREYDLVTLQSFSEVLTIHDGFEEHTVWRKAEKYLSGVAENVRDICQHGLTEILNNVVSHSGSNSSFVTLDRTAADITISVLDSGIGIFKKIQQDFGLADPRQSLLELSKGKLTSDRDNHTGEGIFFTSRMFDDFTISSGTLYFCRFNREDDWLLETKDQEERDGTFVRMRISASTARTAKAVFLEFAPEHNDYGFRKTHVPIQLAIYEGEKLVSRSQARRILSRVNKFTEVLLDFREVESIGQAFADEIFRVFRNANPNTEIIYVCASRDVESMISHVRAVE